MDSKVVTALFGQGDPLEITSMGGRAPAGPVDQALRAPVLPGYCPAVVPSVLVAAPGEGYWPGTEKQENTRLDAEEESTMASGKTALRAPLLRGNMPRIAALTGEPGQEGAVTNLEEKRAEAEKLGGRSLGLDAAAGIGHTGRQTRARANDSPWFARLARLACLASLLLTFTIWGLQRKQGPSSHLLTAHKAGSQNPGWYTKAIETIRPGDKVLTAQGKRSEKGETEVDPRTWKLVKLRAWARWADGTLDDINIETLQPPEWLAAENVREGGYIPLPLDLLEMGLSEDLRGLALAIKPCPAIKPGPGRLVLTTVNHLNAYVRELTVEDCQGHREKIRPTGFHKFYRASDGQWLSAEDLEAGDQLQGQNGGLRVVANTRVSGVHRVYNMTVEGEHVYRVSSLGVLTHNLHCDGSVPKWGNAPATGGVKGHAHKHGGVGRIPSKPPKYYKHALENMRNGTRYRFYHDGQFKFGYVTKIGEGRYVFTSVSKNGKTIFTHMEVSEQYLRNLGITLKGG
jgi:hypothetical protein